MKNLYNYIWLKFLAGLIIKGIKTRLDWMGINYAQLRIILKVDNSFTSRSGKRTKVHARSCFVALCSKSSSSQSSEGELTWKGKNSPPGVGKKSNSLRSFPLESLLFHWNAIFDQRSCVQALSSSTWTFTPAWSERSLKVENGTGPEFSLFAHPTSGTQLASPRQKKISNPGPSREDAEIWHPAAQQCKHPFVCLTCFC